MQKGGEKGIELDDIHVIENVVSTEHQGFKWLVDSQALCLGNQMTIKMIFISTGKWMLAV